MSFAFTILNEEDLLRSNTEALRELTTATTDIRLIREQAIKEGMTTLRESAIDKMMAGITTYQDVQRVTWEMI